MPEPRCPARGLVVVEVLNMRRTLPSFRALCWAGLAVTVTVVGVAKACLWDYDTLKAEAAGLPGIVEIITGRFDRFPPVYYEMRLERVAGEIEAGSTDLELYDNAGVACDRLGRHDDAIEWMARKLAAIEAIESVGGDTGEHRYRYLANLGTFHVHRWLANGADRSNMTDVARSRDLIAEAIAVNPDAHFGRERYQLLAIEWLLDPPPINSEFTIPTIFAAKAGELYVAPSNVLEKAGFDDAVNGLSGIITLGSGWESVDLFHALAMALADQGDGVMAFLAGRRVAELQAAGSVSLHPQLGQFDLMIEEILPDRAQSKTNAFYDAARVEADGWRVARERFVSGKLNHGLHPDTHPGFWDDWTDPTSPPALPTWGSPHRGFIVVIATLTGVLAIAISLVVWLVVLKLKAGGIRPA